MNPEWHNEDVPFLAQMCGSADSWHAAMLQWFDGRILSEESKRYIQNFLVVTRTRPEDDDLDANSDDILSDEELIIDNSTFEEAISTRVGPGKTAQTAGYCVRMTTATQCQDHPRRSCRRRIV